VTPTPQKRRRNRDWALWAFVAVMIVQGLVNWSLADTGADLIDELRADVDADTIATCNRGNASRIEINKGTFAGAKLAEAGDALVEAVARTAEAIDGSAQVLVAAATGGESLSPEDQAVVDQFLAGTAALTDAIEVQIAAADQLYAEAAALEVDAILPLRDCAVVLEDPEATIPVVTP
jgi:hypothetical protein